MDENAAARRDVRGRERALRGPNGEPVGGDAGDPGLARRRTAKLDSIVADSRRSCSRRSLKSRTRDCT